jgi:hypothetical protein
MQIGYFTPKRLQQINRHSFAVYFISTKTIFFCGQGVRFVLWMLRVV